MEKIQAAITADVRNTVFDTFDSSDEPQILTIEAITGDGAQTVIADVARAGASTDLVSIYRVERGAVTQARFKDRKGHIDSGGSFVVGASVMHSSTVALSSAQHALFAKRIMNGDEDDPDASCEVRAYQWNPHLKMFVERASRATDEVHCKHQPLH